MSRWDFEVVVNRTEIAHNVSVETTLNVECAIPPYESLDDVTVKFLTRTCSRPQPPPADQESDTLIEALETHLEAVRNAYASRSDA